METLDVIEAPRFISGALYPFTLTPDGNLLLLMLKDPNNIDHYTGFDCTITDTDTNVIYSAVRKFYQNMEGLIHESSIIDVNNQNEVKIRIEEVR